MLATWASVDDALEALAVLLQAGKPHSLRLLGADVLHAGVRSLDCFAVCWRDLHRVGCVPLRALIDSFSSYVELSGCMISD